MNSQTKLQKNVQTEDNSKNEKNSTKKEEQKSEEYSEVGEKYEQKMDPLMNQNNKINEDKIQEILKEKEEQLRKMNEF